MQGLHSRGERGSSILASLIIAATLGGAALVADFTSPERESQLAMTQWTTNLGQAAQQASLEKYECTGLKPDGKRAGKKYQVFVDAKNQRDPIQVKFVGFRDDNKLVCELEYCQLLPNGELGECKPNGNEIELKEGFFSCFPFKDNQCSDSFVNSELTERIEGLKKVAEADLKAYEGGLIPTAEQEAFERALYKQEPCYLEDCIPGSSETPSGIRTPEVLADCKSNPTDPRCTPQTPTSPTETPTDCVPFTDPRPECKISYEPKTEPTDCVPFDKRPECNIYYTTKQPPNDCVPFTDKRPECNIYYTPKNCTYQGPCQYGQMDPCTGKCPDKPIDTPPPGVDCTKNPNDPRCRANTFQQPPPQFTADKGPWGQQTMGQPPPGNQTPRPPGTCPAGQTLCSGNTLYSRNNQCVDTVVQYCQYGCAAQQQQSSGSTGVLTGILSMFGGGGGAAPAQSGQCAPPPSQGGNCPQPPAQPTTQCTNGQWKPTYGPPPNTTNTVQTTANQNNCVVGWQCVPEGAVQLKAELSCEPKIGDAGTTIALSYTCSAGTSEGSGFTTGGARSGATTTTLQKPPGNTNTATYTLKCTDGTQEAKADCSVQVSKASIVLIANPEAVRRNETSRIGWITSGMKSCVISSPDDDEFTEDNEDNDSVNGTAVSEPLRRSTEFVLTCETQGGATKEEKIEVNVI